MLQLAGDVSDPQSQRAAFTFLSKSVGVWGQPLPDGTTGEIEPGSQGVPGFERFVYENVVPTAFAVLSLPELNIKDGQVLVVWKLRSFLYINDIQCFSSGPPRNCWSSADNR
jgi:exportin-T